MAAQNEPGEGAPVARARRFARRRLHARPVDDLGAGERGHHAAVVADAGEEGEDAGLHALGADFGDDGGTKKRGVSLYNPT